MDKASVSRVVLLVITLINSVLNLVGYETIPGDAGEGISALILVGVALWTAWKNNYVGKKGKEQAEVLKQHGLK